MGKKAGIVVLLAIAGIMLVLRFSKKPVPLTQSPNLEKELVETGRRLFFDTRLSFNNMKSCASCHDPKFAFTDGYRRSITASGEQVKHNAPSLINIVLHKYFDWANPSVTTLSKQQERPLFSEHPTEMGAKGNETAILNRLKSDSTYQRLFSLAFANEKDPFSFPNIIRAISAFEATLRSADAPYDRFMKGDSMALSVNARRGMELFFSRRLNCGACHMPPQFTSASFTVNTDSIYFNTGLYNIANSNHYPAADRGLAEKTGQEADDGKFKVPSLRNVALTAPYMHDGSINTIEEVIDMYQQGGRNITSGPDAGDGRSNKLKSVLIKGFSLTPTEKKELISFLFSLTDSTVLKNPAFQNPFNLPDK